MKEHDTAGAGCWCKPEIMRTEGSDVIIHKVLITYKTLFKGVLSGEMVLTNDREGAVMASWQAGGQDFTVYAR